MASNKSIRKSLKQFLLMFNFYLLLILKETFSFLKKSFSNIENCLVTLKTFLEFIELLQSENKTKRENNKK